MDLQRLENALKERWGYPYQWGRKQSNDWDRQTNFIYQTYSVNALLRKSTGFSDALTHYALNRWYNFWSAQGVEAIFCMHDNVKAVKNRYDKLVDFSINNIPFDHKTSVFPRGFGGDVTYAKNNPKELIEWLYRNQSQEGRKHYKNRLFIVLYDGHGGEHWKLKAEIALLRQRINQYIKHFSADSLTVLDFGAGKVYADVLWVEK